MKIDSSASLAHHIRPSPLSRETSAGSDKESFECTQDTIFGDHFEIQESARADGKSYLEKVRACSELSDDQRRKMGSALEGRVGKNISDLTTVSDISDVFSDAINESKIFSKFLNFKFGSDFNGIEKLSFSMANEIERSEENPDDYIVIFVPERPDSDSERLNWRAEVIYQFTRAVVYGDGTDHPDEFDAKAKVLAASVVNELANLPGWEIPNFMRNWIDNSQQNVSLLHSRVSDVIRLNQETQHLILAADDEFDFRQKNKTLTKNRQNASNEINPESKYWLINFLKKPFSLFKSKQENRPVEDVDISSTTKL